MLFEMAKESPGSRAVIFIDEVDSMGSSRSEVVGNSSHTSILSEIMIQMSKERGNVFVLAATNLPWHLDPAIRRRFKKRIYIPLPDHNARSVMVKIHLGDTPNNLKNDDFVMLGSNTEGKSGSDIQALVEDALMEPLQHCKRAKQFIRDGGGGVATMQEISQLQALSKEVIIRSS